MEQQGDFIKTELQKFNITDSAIAEMKIQFFPILVKDPFDKENYTKAREARLFVKGRRVEVEKKRKELKEASLRFGRAVDIEAKRITTQLEEIENHLQTQEDIVTKHKEQMEAEAKQKAEQKRIEKEAAIEAEKKHLEAERQAIEAEKKHLEAERQAIEAEKRKIEYEKQRQIELEQAKQKAARKAILETEQRIKREAEEKQRQIELEQRSRALLEEEKKREEERQNANRPDKEKLIVFILTLTNLELPQVTSKEGKEIVSQIAEQLEELKEHIGFAIERL